MRIGIVGTNWGRMHVGAFRGAGAEVVAICGRDLDKTRAIAAEERIELGTDDVARLAASCDAVVIASPDALHEAHASIALDAGRHVLIEKPIAIDVPSADRLVEKAARASSIAAVCFPYRMLPPFAELRSCLAGRRVHALNVLVRNSFLRGSIVGSGDLGGASHVIDAAFWLAGARADGITAALTLEPLHTLSLQASAGGTRVSIEHRAAFEPGIHGCWSLLGDGFEARIEGGYLPALGGWRVGPLRMLEGDRWRTVGSTVEPRAGAREPWAEAHVATARAFLGRIAGRPAEALATVEDGAFVQHVIDAALRSHATGARVTPSSVC